jgi:RNA polymerase sigma factor (sigma-70 family)
VEASTIPATAVLAPQRRGLASTPTLLRLRSDEQLVRLFRDGSEEAFRVIHDRYRARLLAYARQMLAGSRQDAEDALQDVFVRAYAALRANDRDVALRAWLYRVAHNRCIDELRRPAPPPPEAFELMRPPASDPIAATEQRESLRRLVADVQRLPEQQRSALLMREIVGLPYQDLAHALDVTVPAVKSLLVRARIGLAQAAQARDTACAEIREELADAHERGVRASGLARRHLHDCDACRAYRGELRSASARFAALTPALGPVALLAKLLGIGGGGAGAGSAAGAGAGGAGAAVSAGGAGAAAGGFSATHVVAAVAAAVVGAGGAVEVQQTLVAPSHAHHRHAPIVRSHTAPSHLLPPGLRAMAPGLVAPPAVDPAGAATTTEPPADAAPATAVVPGEQAPPVPEVPDAGPINGGAAAPEALDEPAPPDAGEPPAADGDTTDPAATADGTSSGSADQPAPTATESGATTSSAPPPTGGATPAPTAGSDLNTTLR